MEPHLDEGLPARRGQGFVDFGVVRWAGYDLDPPQVFGNWAGYFDNSLSLSRPMGERMPGVTAAASDKADFGDHPGVPPYDATERIPDGASITVDGSTGTVTVIEVPEPATT